MSNLVNPEYKPHLELVDTQEDWDALKATITTHLQANAGSSTLDVVVMRALDSEFSDDKIWAQITSDMGLFETVG